jgi:hypothetical protein
MRFVTFCFFEAAAIGFVLPLFFFIAIVFSYLF